MTPSLQFKRSQLWIPLVGTCAFELGAIVFLGWMFGIKALIQIHPSFPPMCFNTALSFTLVGASLTLWRWKGAKWILVVPFLIASFSLSQDLLGLDFGIDELFVKARGFPHMPSPGRMAPNTSVGFILIALGFFLFDVRKKDSDFRQILLLMCSFLVLSVTATSIFGYLAGISPVYSWSGMTGMALHTAFGQFLLALSLAVLTTAGELGSSWKTKRWLPVPIGVASVATTLLVWQAMLNHERGHIKRIVEMTAENRRDDAVDGIKTEIEALRRMTNRAIAGGSTYANIWGKDAENHVGDIFHRLYWITPKFQIWKMIPEGPILHDLTGDVDRLGVLTRAKVERRIVSSRSLRLLGKGGIYGLFLASPIVRNNQVEGFLAASIDLGKLLRHLMPPSKTKGYAVSVFEGDRQLFSSTEGAALVSSLEVRSEAEFIDGSRWSFRLIPTEEEVKQRSSRLAELVLLIGMLLSLILMVVVYLAQTAYRRMEEAQATREKVRSSLAEKEVLLREIHHRVKNNLNVVSSLLDLQARYLPDPKLKEAFKESKNRVTSMALVHEILYQSKNIARIDFKKYVENLVQGIYESYGVDTNRFKPEIRINNVEFEVDTAIPCSLIINELVSNSLKHGFKGKASGHLSISLNSLSDCPDYELIVSDDGVGSPPGFSLGKSGSLGLKLVTSLAQQLGGEIKEVHPPEGGMGFGIRFHDHNNLGATSA